MLKSNNMIKQIRNKVDEYIEEQRRQNAKRAEQEKLVAEINSLKVDAQNLNSEAKKITAIDKAARDEYLKSLIPLLGLKMEQQVGTETEYETHYDRDGDYDVAVTKYRAYACLVDKFGHTVHKARVYDRYYGFGDKITKEDTAKIKQGLEEFDVLSLFADFMQSEKALDVLKETYLHPEKWELESIEKQLRESVHDIGLETVKKTLVELKKQVAPLAKELRAADKAWDRHSHSWEMEGKEAKYKKLNQKMIDLKRKIGVHENARDLYLRKAIVEKGVAKVKADVKTLGIIEAIEKIAPSQKKYLEVKVEADKTLKAMDEIQRKIANVKHTSKHLVEEIQREDKEVVNDVLESGVVSSIVSKFITEEYVKTSECEDVRRNCYVQMSSAKVDNIDRQIASEVFNKIEAMSQTENEREDI